MCAFPEKRYYTSSEAMKFAIQPGISPIPARIEPATSKISAPRYSEKPDFQPLLKPSEMKLASELYRVRNFDADRNPYTVGSDFQHRLKEHTRIVSPSPAAGPRFRVTSRSKKPSLESAVSRNAPFAQRTASLPQQNSSFRAHSRSALSYNSLFDPHLHDYFSRKFMEYPAEDTSRRVKRRKPVVDTLYKVLIVTADQHNAGTTANVFIRINGRSTKVPKHRLTKKSGLVKTVNGKRFRFLPGSENSFKIRGPSIRWMKNIVIETDGLTKRESFLVEKVEVTNVRTKKTWIFLCGRWLSLYEQDCLISRELYPELQTTKFKQAAYGISTVTGDNFCAGTDANVFITIYGERGSTPRLHLYHSDKSDPFERGQTDHFTLRTKHVGKLKKIRIEHDNTGRSPGWYLVEVLVKNTKTKESYKFPCGQWLAKDEGDGRTCRDLLPFGEKFSGNGKVVPYNIDVYTGNKMGAGTDANVYAIIFGKKGDSGEFQLKGSGNLFEKGSKDTFIQSFPDLGDLTKFRIRHDNSGIAPGWFLEKVVVNDQKTSAVFQCQRWLAKDEDDGKISRDLVRRGKGQLTPYDIEIRTGNIRHAGTDANVYIELHASKDAGQSTVSSGKIWLEAAKEKFERGNIDKFRIDVAGKLSPLSHITLGHDNFGMAPGWFVDEVIVLCPTTGLEQHFPCKKWFATDEDDGLIERDIPEDKSLRRKREKMIAWDVLVHTSDKRGAGTDARVYLTLYGNKGKSDLLYLDNHSDKFERGQTDQFLIETPEIGKPYKIRIGHDNSNPAAGWHLESVEMVNRLEKKKYVFPCKRWLATDEDDGEIVRELPAEGPNIKNPMPVLKYQVDVHTGNKFRAGTDADVFCCLFGSHGDTGDRPLLHSQTHKNKFERGNMDSFIFEAVDLKELEKLKIGHNGKGPGAGWFLDKVIAKCLDNSKYDTIFPCGRWLADDEDDGKIVRELYPADLADATRQNLLKSTSYHLSIKTGDVRNAGTDSNVFVQMYGKNGDTGEMMLLKSENNKNPFERGRIDLFTVEAGDIGKIKKLKIGYDGKGIGSGWFLEYVEVNIPSRGEGYRFPCGRWLARDEGDGELQVELFPEDFQKREKDIPYEVTVTTGEERGAGTDANVFLQIYGDCGKTEIFQLRNNTDNFERGSTDLFKLEGHDVGSILKIRIGTDGKGMASGWFLDLVKIRKPVSTRKRNSIKKIRSRSIQETESENWKQALQGRKSTRSNSTTGKFDTARKKSSSTESESSDFSIDNYEDSRSENSDEEIERKFSGSSYQRNDDSQTLTRSTKRRSSAGDTLSRGSKHRSGSTASSRSKKYKEIKRRLSSLNKEMDNKVESNECSDDSEYTERVLAQKCRYEKLKKRLSRQSLGSLYGGSESGSEHSEKYSNNSRKNDKQEAAIETYYFVCRRWFSKNEDDGALVRELLPTDPQGRPLKGNSLELVRYEVHVFTGEVSGAGTDANVFLNLYGEFGDSGERQLNDSSTHRNKFERGQEDVFTVEAGDLGELKKLKIWHDNSGIGAAWYLDRIEVADPRENRHRYVFPCEDWLSLKKGDGQICRELVSVNPEQLKKLNRRKGSHTGSMKDELGLEISVWAYEGGTDADVTEIQDFRIGHDNKGGFSDWFLDSVDIDCPSLGKKWHFPCERWLAKNRDDGQLERELCPAEADSKEYEACVPYEFTVYTSDLRGAATDADVFVALYGKDGATRQTSLCSDKQQRKECFNRGSVDKFIIEMEDVGDEITKLRIGHDGSGWGAGWHLNKVEVKKLLRSGSGHLLYTFHCDKWLARDEDDGSIVRDLVPSSAVRETTRKDGSVKQQELNMNICLKMKRYEIKVYTGDVNMAGTDSNVFLRIYGEKGDSGERQLKDSETHFNKFERAHVDIFSWEAADLGTLYKVDISHDNAMLMSDWFLDRIEIRDLDDNKHYLFDCGKWLKEGNDGGKTLETIFEKNYNPRLETLSKSRKQSLSNGFSKNNYAISTSKRTSRRLSDGSQHSFNSYDADNYSNIPYTIKVSIGDSVDSGTDDPIWIRILDEKNQIDTGKIYLEIRGRHPPQLLPGTTETFSIDAPYVGKIKAMELGIDSNSKKSSCLIKEVEVHQPTKGRAFFFVINSWFGFGKKNGVIRKKFYPEDSLTPALTKKQLIPYEAYVYTGEKSGSVTDCSIFFKLFGTDGSSSEIVDRFVQGKVDVVKVEIEDVGTPVKLRVGLREEERNKKANYCSWYLEKIELCNLFTDKSFVFSCGDWLSTDSRSGFPAVRDLPSLTARGKSIIKTTTYAIRVKTSDIRYAGTSADATCILFGEHGDSGELQLCHSGSHKHSFQRNEIDVFVFENILCLGRLRTARIWHDNSGFGASWHLEYLEVTDKSSKETFVFPCGKWLSSTEGDQQIYRELTCVAPSTSTEEPKEPAYEVTVVTGDKREAGTVHHGWIVLHSRKESSKQFWCENSSRKKIFRRGQSDKFKFKCSALGSIKCLTLGHYPRDGVSVNRQPQSDRENAWYCHEIVVVELQSGRKFTFPCKDWVPLSSKARDALELRCASTEEGQAAALEDRPLVQYEIVVVTGDERGAGTDANVSATLLGQFGDSGPRPLKQRFRNLFERGQTDVFTVEAFDLGKLEKLMIEHDSSGFAAGWLLDRVEVKNRNSGQVTVFPCGKWLDKDRGDCLTKRELYPNYLSH